MAKTVKIMPTRDAHQEVRMIADLDDLIGDPIGFKFNGKGYLLRPVSTENYLRISKAYEKVMKGLNDRSDHTIEEIQKCYHEFFSSVCPELSLQDVQSMTIQQMTQLIGLLMCHITGQTTNEYMGVNDSNKGKKKIQMAQKINPSILHRLYHSCVSFIHSVIRRS